MCLVSFITNRCGIIALLDWKSYVQYFQKEFGCGLTECLGRWLVDLERGLEVGSFGGSFLLLTFGFFDEGTK